MKIKLIASDMDDTLLNNNREISPRNEAAIKKLSKAELFLRLLPGVCIAQCSRMRKSLALMCRWFRITAHWLKARSAERFM